MTDDLIRSNSFFADFFAKRVASQGVGFIHVVTGGWGGWVLDLANNTTVPYCRHLHAPTPPHRAALPHTPRAIHHSRPRAATQPSLHSLHAYMHEMHRCQERCTIAAATLLTVDPSVSTTATTTPVFTHTESQETTATPRRNTQPLLPIAAAANRAPAACTTQPCCCYSRHTHAAVISWGTWCPQVAAAAACCWARPLRASAPLGRSPWCTPCSTAPTLGTLPG